MKPCRQYRKPIVWLTLGAVDEPQAKELREHLRNCEACREYLEEISVLKQKLGSLETPSDIETSEAFHKRLKRTVTAQPSAPGNAVWDLLRGPILNWRVAFPVIVVTCLVALTFAFFAKRSDTPRNLANRHPVQTVSVPAQDVPPPTISAYQVAASQSLEKLDDLLSLQARQSPPAAPAQAAAIFASLAKSDY